MFEQFFTQPASPLQAAGHRDDADGPLFQPLKNPAGQGKTDRPLTPGAIYHRALRKHEALIHQHDAAVSFVGEG